MNSTRYGYSAWLRHLIVALKNDLPTNPDVVAGPDLGNSLGTGLATLIYGANKYYAFDVVDYTNKKRKLAVFDALVKLFKNCENVPDNNEFPKVKPYLETYEFPNYIVTDERLSEALRPDRIESKEMIFET